MRFLGDLDVIIFILVVIIMGCSGGLVFASGIIASKFSCQFLDGSLGGLGEKSGETGWTVG